MSSTTDAIPAPIWRAHVRRWLKPAVFTLSLLPFLWAVVEGINLLVGLFPSGLGANPIEAIIRFLGDWALRFVLIALAVTPARLLTGWNEFGRLRRMLGLFAFFYVAVHVSCYVGLDQFFDWNRIGADIVKRLFITFGMFSLTMLIPLAITSTDRMARRLGGKRWRQLHMLVYPAAIAGVIHYYEMIKAEKTQALIYGAILAALFAVRLYKKWA
jgi:sulfoxide reductase heme-binding subunit YedZ